MTTEFVLLLALTVFTITGIFLNKDTGVVATFQSSGPKLAARIEKHLETGKDFADASQNWSNPINWKNPPPQKGGPR